MYTQSYKNVSTDKITKLELLHSGYAKVDGSWCGNAVRSQYSRLYFIKSGSFYIIDNDGNRTDFKEGKAYLVPSGTSYTYGCEKENEHYYFHIRLYGADKIDVLAKLKKVVSCNPFHDLELLSQMIGQKTTTASLVIKSAIYNSLSDLALNYGHLLNTPSFSFEINSAVDFISENLTAALTVSEIATAVNIANSTLSAKFKKEVGVSVSEYLDYRLILSAMELLTTTEKSISEISDILGYSDQFYFSRRFKKRYGISPKKFRNIK